MNKEKQNNQNRILFLSLLSVQRSLSIKYNECSMKCADEPLREDILNILRENHAMYHTLFDESRSRGWETESAPRTAQGCGGPRRFFASWNIFRILKAHFERRFFIWRTSLPSNKISS